MDKDPDDHHDDDGYNHEELVHAAIDDLNDDASHTNEVFKNALNELSHHDPSTMHSNMESYQSQSQPSGNVSERFGNSFEIYLGFV